MLAQGRCSAKKVRLSSRLTPLSARLIPSQTSAVVAVSVFSSVHRPRWKSVSMMSCEMTGLAKSSPSGTSSTRICAIPLPSRPRRPARSSRATARLRTGNRTVTIATLKMPCGSM
ncbi:unannotated protein [freshwater metagenome]|uniref:Unannotated protein n=1 Tax=freshwater metagenome TaxID=449393 RepID=A0A6J7L6E6_9ZZZZ